MNIEFTVLKGEDDYKLINQQKGVIDRDIHYGVFGEFFFYISSNHDFPLYLQDYSIHCKLSLCKFFVILV